MFRKFLLVAATLAPLLLARACYGQSLTRNPLPVTTLGQPSNALTPPPLVNNGAGIAPLPQATPGGVAPAGAFDAFATDAAAAPTLAPTVTGDPFATEVDPLTGQSPGLPFPSAQPPVLFPQSETIFPNGILPGSFVPPGALPAPLKLFQNWRASHTHLFGDDLTIDDTEVGLTLTLPAFLYSAAPLYIAPGFVFHFWDDARGFLPDEAYSAFVDFVWSPRSHFVPQLHYELGLRLGVFGDFSEVATDTFRLQGSALAALAVSPTISYKAGVVYLDRVDKKILPAGGVVWTPNERVKFDIVFPNPKLSQYLTTIGATTVWWHVFGEYGGGSWTVTTGERFGERFDRIDINDIRLGAGLDWFWAGGCRGFVEAAWVFDREVVSDELSREFKQDDTIMLRGGVSF